LVAVVRDIDGAGCMANDPVGAFGSHVEPSRLGGYSCCTGQPVCSPPLLLASILSPKEKVYQFQASYNIVKPNENAGKWRQLPMKGYSKHDTGVGGTCSAFFSMYRCVATCTRA
jgi:hypothetical protein